MKGESYFFEKFPGGHIKKAINICDLEELKKKFIDGYKPSNKPQAIVFYCEYSSKRGPTW
jgi:hypothetical protein